MSRISIKSKFHAEFKRFFIKDDINFKLFESTVRDHHGLTESSFLIFYTDPTLGDLLPINNDENFAKAISVHKVLFRLVIILKGEQNNDPNYYNKKRNFLENIKNLVPASNTKTPKLEINLMEDFHQVSSIIDADVIPKEQRRVKITKHGSDKPLGFYIRDGISIKITPAKILKVRGIFISRLVNGGLAESTGLLAVGDEVLEVNGIEVLNKTIEQVTDMMVANASNLILTTKPASQYHYMNESFISNKSNTNSLQRESGEQHKYHQQFAQPQVTTYQQSASINKSLDPVKSQMQHQFDNQPTNVLQPHSQQQNIITRQQMNQQQPNVLQNNIYSNVLQNNMLQNSLHQVSDAANMNTNNSSNQASLYNNYIHQYSSLRPAYNQKTTIHLQHNNSFNYPKAPMNLTNIANLPSQNHQQQDQQQQQQQQQENQAHLNNSNQFINSSSSSRQNLGFFNAGYGKIGDYVNLPMTSSQNIMQSNMQNHSTSHSFTTMMSDQSKNHAQTRQRSDENSKRSVVGITKFDNITNNNDNIIERLKQGFFDEPNHYDDDDEEDEEEDKVMVHVKNFDNLSRLQG